MSLQRCVVDGKAGWQWGNGKCHVGAGGQARAEREGATEEVEAPAPKAKVSAPKTTEPETVTAKKPAAKKKAATNKT